MSDSIADRVKAQGDVVRKLKADKADKEAITAAVKILKELKAEEAAANGGAAAPAAAAASDSIAARIKAQGDVVRQLKADKADKEAITAAVKVLKDLKAEEAAANASANAAVSANETRRDGFETLLRRRFIIAPSFDIYGGTKGLYDFGPPGVAIMENFKKVWRHHFVLTEDMLEIGCSTLTPERVLTTSGHVAKFTDFMCKDVVTGEPHRADRVLEDQLETMANAAGCSPEQRAEYLKVRAGADGYTQAVLGDMIEKYSIVSPDTGNALSAPFPFNLMFATQIGPSGNLRGFLRPETAQGIFVNFKKLLEYNRGAMPFAAAQMGLAFRNEISPRSGLLRVREFTLGEIEHFVHPEHKEHKSFHKVKDVEMRFLSAEKQTGEDTVEVMTMGEAVAKKMVDNETIGYFMARTHLFLLKIGVDASKLRFRQHTSDEMAHYAQDCWDAEYHSVYGWVECVGHADRSCYDLTVHSKATKVDLEAQMIYDEPKMVEMAKSQPDKKKIGKAFRGAAKAVTAHLAALGKDDGLALVESLKAGPTKITVDDAEYEITPDMYSMSVVMEKVSVERYMPSVIEPSFGVGRIMYGLLEHCYEIRDGVEDRCVLKLPPVMAPYKASILPLSNKPELCAVAQDMRLDLIGMDLACEVDASNASIGKRYARADELGTPFGVTVDFESLTDNTVTVRDRDTMTQVRVKCEEVAELIQSLCRNTRARTWADVYAKYPQVMRPVEGEEGGEDAAKKPAGDGEGKAKAAKK